MSGDRLWPVRGARDDSCCLGGFQGLEHLSKVSAAVHADDEGERAGVELVSGAGRGSGAVGVVRAVEHDSRLTGEDFEAAWVANGGEPGAQASRLEGRAQVGVERGHGAGRVVGLVGAVEREVEVIEAVIGCGDVEAPPSRRRCVGSAVEVAAPPPELLNDCDPLSASGTPAKAITSPARTRVSTCRAAASAPSASTCANARTRLSDTSIRARQPPMTSSAVTISVWTRSAISTAVAVAAMSTSVRERCPGATADKPPLLPGGSSTSAPVAAGRTRRYPNLGQVCPGIARLDVTDRHRACSDVAAAQLGVRKSVAKTSQIVDARCRAAPLTRSRGPHGKASD